MKQKVNITQKTSLCFCVPLQLWWPALQRAAVCQLSHKTQLQICSGGGKPARGCELECQPGARRAAKAAFSAWEVLDVILKEF